MTNKPSRTAERALDHRADILRLLQRLSPERITDLDRRARFLAEPDGFPPGGSNGRGSDIARPTEQAAARRLDDDQPADPIGAQIRHVLAALNEAAGVLAPVDRWLSHLDAYGDKAIVREHSKTGDCKACERVVTGTPNDRLRNGYCDRCRMAYQRWTVDHPVGSDPAAHRLEFERWRRVRLAEVPEPMAPPAASCGHRCCNRVVGHEHWHEPTSCPDCRSAEVAS